MESKLLIVEKRIAESNHKKTTQIEIIWQSKYWTLEVSSNKIWITIYRQNNVLINVIGKRPIYPHIVELYVYCCSDITSWLRVWGYLQLIKSETKVVISYRFEVFLWFESKMPYLGKKKYCFQLWIVWSRSDFSCIPETASQILLFVEITRFKVARCCILHLKLLFWHYKFYFSIKNQVLQ